MPFLERGPQRTRSSGLNSYVAATQNMAAAHDSEVDLVDPVFPLSRAGTAWPLLRGRLSLPAQALFRSYSSFTGSTITRPRPRRTR